MRAIKSALLVCALVTTAAAQSPEMLGSPLERRRGRFDISPSAARGPRTSLTAPPSAFTYWPYRSMRLPFSKMIVWR